MCDCVERCFRQQWLDFPFSFLFFVSEGKIPSSRACTCRQVSSDANSLCNVPPRLPGGGGFFLPGSPRFFRQLVRTVQPSHELHRRMILYAYHRVENYSTSYHMIQYLGTSTQVLKTPLLFQYNLSTDFLSTSMHDTRTLNR